MNFELSLILIQTITGLFSLYLGYKAIDLNQNLTRIQMIAILIRAFIIKPILKILQQI